MNEIRNSVSYIANIMPQGYNLREIRAPFNFDNDFGNWCGAVYFIDWEKILNRPDALRFGYIYSYNFEYSYLQIYLTAVQNDRGTICYRTKYSGNNEFSPWVYLQLAG